MTIQRYNYRRLITPILVGVFLFLLMYALPAFAQSPDPLGVRYGQASGLSAQNDVRFIVARVIRIVLSLLGTIAIVLIVYSGFTWMTSAGNDEKIGKAKKIIIASVIGLGIIMSAYVITEFVVTNLYNSVTTSPVYR